MSHIRQPIYDCTPRGYSTPNAALRFPCSTRFDYTLWPLPPKSDMLLRNECHSASLQPVHWATLATALARSTARRAHQTRASKQVCRNDVGPPRAAVRWRNRSIHCAGAGCHALLSDGISMKRRRHRSRARESRRPSSTNGPRALLGRKPARTDGWQAAARTLRPALRKARHRRAH